MGQSVSSADWSNQQRQRYREKVRQDLDVFEQMLATSSFDVKAGMTGMEMELNLVGGDAGPSQTNASVLETLGDEAFQTELARFNIELNVEPRPLQGDNLQALEDDVCAALARADAAAQQHGARVAAVGILPTLLQEQFTGDWISEGVRYAALNEAIMRARGEDTFLDISGDTGERWTMYSESIAPEAACTSLQLHLQVAPHDFAAYWNAAQVLAGPQVAIGANSPFLCGHALWHETRIPLFTQAADTRPLELANQGVRPRVSFGERWITSIFDLFEDNVRYYPALLAEVSDEDPVAAFDEGRPPELAELRLHNGTIWRWNRPIYDTAGGRPHLRVENRILPAGPSTVDVIANAAFYYGALRRLAAEDRPLWTQMSFSAAQANFEHGARDGMNAYLYWPSYAQVPPGELCLRHLLPFAQEGLADWGVDDATSGKYLSIIEARCASRRNGATWQRQTVAALQDAGADRRSALVEMFRRYLEFSQANLPVHTWELPPD